MAVVLADLVEPAHAAVVTVECQRGVIGDLAMMAALRDEVVAKGSLEAAGTLCRRARAAGVPVVHCTVELRADGVGSISNSRLMAMSAKVRAAGGGPIEGTPATELVPELDAQPSDLVVARRHGVTPFSGTDLDQLLRNLGVTTVIPVGQSVNIAISGLVMNAVDFGYQVVLPHDAVAGVPAAYADSVIENALSLLATGTTVAEITASWS